MLHTGGIDGYCILRDGRTLAYRTFWDATKPMVLYLGGLISSRLEPEIFYDERFFIVGIDRPWYGKSSYNPVQTAESLADDVAQLLAYFGRERCRVFGVSWGWAYAIAIASIRPDIVESIAAFASISPYGTVSTAWHLIDKFPLFVARPYWFWVQLSIRRIVCLLPAKLLRVFLICSLRTSTIDKQVLTQERVRVFAASFYEALRLGIHGLLADLRQYIQAWPPNNITHTAVPIRIYHGMADTITPVACTHWHADHLPNYSVRFFPYESHAATPILHMREAFDFLAQN